jgi:anaerobic selenocysteine-containing dehydrogenase
VLIDEDRCRGYRFCMAACPYKKIYFNHERGVANKCIFCLPRIEKGVATACSRQCPGRVRFMGYRDDQAAPVYKLVDHWKVAVPLHPEYGTEPNVFYVPPISPPAFKEPPRAGGNFPLVLSGGHTRWSIHSLQRTDPIMLRLQRGEPCLFMSVEDARERGLSDWDRTEVFNDVGRFVVRVKISAAIRPGLLMHYHGWEDFQYEGGAGYRNVTPSPLNPLEMAGGYPYLAPQGYVRQPGMSDRDTRVEVRRL